MAARGYRVRPQEPRHVPDGRSRARWSLADLAPPRLPELRRARTTCSCSSTACADAAERPVGPARLPRPAARAAHLELAGEHVAIGRVRDATARSRFEPAMRVRQPGLRVR